MPPRPQPRQARPPSAGGQYASAQYEGAQYEGGQHAGGDRRYVQAERRYDDGRRGYPDRDHGYGDGQHGYPGDEPWLEDPRGAGRDGPWWDPDSWAGWQHWLIAIGVALAAAIIGAALVLLTGAHPGASAAAAVFLRLSAAG